MLLRHAPFAATKYSCVSAVVWRTTSLMQRINQCYNLHTLLFSYFSKEFQQFQWRLTNNAPPSNIILLSYSNNILTCKFISAHRVLNHYMCSCLSNKLTLRMLRLFCGDNLAPDFRCTVGCFLLVLPLAIFHRDLLLRKGWVRENFVVWDNEFQICWVYISEHCLSSSETN